MSKHANVRCHALVACNCRCVEGGGVKGRGGARSGAGERWNARVLTLVRVGGMVGGRHLYMQHLAVVIWKSEPDPNAGKKS